MLAILRYKRFIAVLSCLSSLGLLGGCLNEVPVSPTPNGNTERVQDSDVQLAYPNYSFFLNVPWIAQVPPGSWSGTKNCGQACGVMLGGYFNNGHVAPWVITESNKFLARRLNDGRYYAANGWYTNFSGRNALGKLLTEFHGLKYNVYYGNRADDVVQEVARGRPVIVGVMIKGGKIVSSGGIAHWALAVGWDGRIFLHDPGSSSGKFKRLTISEFEATWATQGKIYVPVRKH